MGWTLTILDTVASEYGWPEEIIRRMPLVKLFAYYHAIAARNGAECAGPSLVEQDWLAAKRAAKAAKAAKQAKRTHS